MEYTKNYHLPQWAEEDRILMVDFNRAMADIEEGMSGNAESAAELPYAVGSYTGNGGTQDINLGFRPSCLVVRRSGMFDFYPADVYSSGSNIQLSESGFSVVDATMGFPVNASGLTYIYIAFR